MTIPLSMPILSIKDTMANIIKDIKAPEITPNVKTVFFMSLLLLLPWNGKSGRKIFLPTGRVVALSDDFRRPHGKSYFRLLPPPADCACYPPVTESDQALSLSAPPEFFVSHLACRIT